MMVTICVYFGVEKLNVRRGERRLSLPSEASGSLDPLYAGWKHGVKRHGARASRGLQTHTNTLEIIRSFMANFLLA